MVTVKNILLKSWRGRNMTNQNIKSKAKNAVAFLIPMLHFNAKA